MRVHVSLLLLVVVLCSLMANAPAIAGPAGEIVVIGPKGKRSLSAADLASLPLAEVEISDHGTPARFEGVELQRILEQVGAPAGEHLRGKELTKYVVVEGHDGYQVVFSLAELSSAFSARRVILASRRDGKPLTDEEGPFRVVVEGEKRMGRCVRQVATIRIVDAK